MMKRQWMWRSLAPLHASAVLVMLTGTGSAFAQTSTAQTPTAQTPTAQTPAAQTPTAQTPPTTTQQQSPATVVTDSVNVPVQVRTAMRGIPVVNTQQILHKSSLDPEDASTSDAAGPVRLLNNLDLNSVGLRNDLTATSWARTPSASAPTPTSSTSTRSSSSSTSTTSSGAAGANGANGAKQTLAASNALAHAALEGTSEAVVRLGPANAEVVSVSGRGLASAAEITGTCGSLESAGQVSLGTTNLRVLGHEIALPENPEPNTEVALTDIPGLVSGSVILNEQATFGDGVTSKVVAVAPLRLQMRLSLAGLGGLADVEVSLAGNSASVDCAPDGEEPPTTEDPTDPTNPTDPSAPPTTTPQSPSTPTPPAGSGSPSSPSA